MAKAMDAVDAFFDLLLSAFFLFGFVADFGFVAAFGFDAAFGLDGTRDRGLAGLPPDDGFSTIEGQGPAAVAASSFSAAS